MFYISIYGSRPSQACTLYVIHRHTHTDTYLRQASKFAHVHRQIDDKRSLSSTYTHLCAYMCVCVQHSREIEIDFECATIRYSTHM